jgi:hypothetical protein
VHIEGTDYNIAVGKQETAKKGNSDGLKIYKKILFKNKYSEKNIKNGNPIKYNFFQLKKKVPQ